MWRRACVGVSPRRQMLESAGRRAQKRVARRASSSAPAAPSRGGLVWYLPLACSLHAVVTSPIRRSASPLLVPEAPPVEKWGERSAGWRRPWPGSTRSRGRRSRAPRRWPPRTPNLSATTSSRSPAAGGSATCPPTGPCPSIAAMRALLPGSTASPTTPASRSGRAGRRSPRRSRRPGRPTPTTPVRSRSASTSPRRSPSCRSSSGRWCSWSIATASTTRRRPRRSRSRSVR